MPFLCPHSLVALALWAGARAALPSVTLSLTNASDPTNLLLSVMVSWTGIPQPNARDQLHILALPHGPNPVDVRFITASPTWQTGAGHLSLSLPNFRQDYSVQYYCAVPRAPCAVSAALAVPDVPIHGHLVLTGDPKAVRLVWSSRAPGRRPRVRYGLSPGNYTHVADARTTTYTRADFAKCPGIAGSEQKHGLAARYFVPPGHIHSALLSGLQSAQVSLRLCGGDAFLLPVPGSRTMRVYYYTYGADPENPADLPQFAAEASFRSPPQDADTAVRVLAVADWGSGMCEKPTQDLPACGDGGSPGAHKELLHCSTLTGTVIHGCRSHTDGPQQPPASQITAARLQREVTPPDPPSGEADAALPTMLLHAGDISYARGKHVLWDAFLAMLRPVAVRVPYVVAMGNHDYRLLSGGECGVPLTRHFPMPWASPAKPYYALDYGPVRLVVLSTEHPFMPQSAQGKWLAATLRSVDRTRQPWVVACGHKPMYSSGRHVLGPSASKMLRNALEDVFAQFGVDLAVWGHVHNYERTCPMTRKFNCSGGGAPGTTHVVVGTGGHGLHFFPRTHRVGQASRGPEWSHRRLLHFGFLRLVATRREMRGQFVRSDNGEVEDDFVLRRHGGARATGPGLS